MIGIRSSADNKTNPSLPAASRRERDALAAVKALPRSGAWEQAETLCQVLLAGNSGSLEAPLLLANVAAKEGKPDLAIRLLQRVLAVNPDSSAALSGMAALLFGVGREAEAASLAKEAVRLNPADANGHLVIARWCAGSGRLPEAAESFQRAINADPLISQAHSGLANAFANQGKSLSAADSYRRAYKLEPDTAWGRFQLALALIEERRLLEAQASLESVLELDSQAGMAHALLGNVLQKLGQFERAETCLRRAIELQPDRVAPYADLINGRPMTGEDRPLLSKLLEFSQADRLSGRDRRALHYALGKAYEDLGEYEESMRSFDQANRFALQSSGLRFDKDRYAAKFDSIIRRFPREPLVTDNHLGNSDELPVFIVGMIRSGTTLVEQIVSSHPQVAGAGELRYWMEHLDSPLDDIPRQASEYLEPLRTISPTAKRITDKMPHNYAAIGPIHLALPQARIIHVRRSPIDTGLSIYTTPFRTAPDFGHDRDHIVFAYRQYLRIMDHWRYALPTSAMIEIDYEQLIEQPEAVTRRLIAFCGLEWSDQCLHPEQNPRAVETPSRWQVRQPVYGSSVGRWRKFEPWLGSLRDLDKQ